MIGRRALPRAPAQSKPMKRLVPLVVIATAFATPAYADKALIMPFDGKMASAPDLGAKLQKRLASAADKAGIKYELGKVPAAEVAMMAGCDPDRKACRAQIAGLLEADLVITGSIGKAHGKSVKVTVIKYDKSGDKSELSRDLTGKTADDLAAQIDPVAEELLPPLETEATTETATETETETTKKPVETEPPPPAPVPPPEAVAPPPTGQPGTDTSFSLSAVKPYTWAVLGGGAAFLAGGVVALLSAEGKQDDIDGAPSDSVADLEALESLESSARTRFRLSYGLFAVGTVLVGGGAALMVTQGREAVSIAPQPMPGGGGVAMGGRF